MSEQTDLSTIPVEGSSPWSRIGAGAVVIHDGRLVCNDNMPDSFIAYEGLLGQIEAEHRVEVRASVNVISNLGGQGAVIEISRPGLELIVQLHPDRVDVAEREGRRLRWIGTAPADLSRESEIVVRKASSSDDERETLSVEIDGAEILSCAGRGAGTLGVGRVIFGSLGYKSFGASRWGWIAVDAEAPDLGPAVPGDVSSFGSIKSGFRR